VTWGAHDDRLVRYLLGELPPEEQERLEAEFFARDEAFHDLLAAEDDLIDAYCGGGLAGPLRERFEARYLRTDEGRERVEFARALRRLSPGTRPSRRWLPLAASLAAVALLGAAVVYPLVRRARSELAEARSELERLERQIGEREARAAEERKRLDRLGEDLERVRSDRDRLAELLGAPDRPVRIASFTLAAGLLRDQGGGSRQAIPPGTTLVRVALLLEGNEYGRYRVAVETAEGRRVWDAAELAPRRTRRGSAVAVLVPADRLPPGDYVLSLAGVTADGRVEDAAEYAVRITAPR
jgi:hypothetical protein